MKCPLTYSSPTEMGLEFFQGGASKWNALSIVPQCKPSSPPFSYSQPQLGMQTLPHLLSRLAPAHLFPTSTCCIYLTLECDQPGRHPGERCCQTTDL